MAMQSTPEKDAFDPVLAGSGARKRVVSHRPRDPLFQQVEHIDFEVTQKPKEPKLRQQLERIGHGICSSFVVSVSRCNLHL